MIFSEKLIDNTQDIFKKKSLTFIMADQRYSLQIQSQLDLTMKSLHTIYYYMGNDDNIQARLEMDYIMILITELQSEISNLENIGRQPEEI